MTSLQDSYDLLKLSRIELENVIRTQLLENPALELDDSGPSESSDSKKKQDTGGSLVPDVRIERNGQLYVVRLNDEGRRLRVSSLYERMAGQKIKVDGHVDYPYFIEKARAAKWFIKAVELRQSTMLKVTESIFRFQRELLQRGLNHIRPLTLRDIAADIRLPESTITSAAANKWVETPHAIFALDWFFSAPKPTTVEKPRR